MTTMILLLENELAVEVDADDFVGVNMDDMVGEVVYGTYTDEKGREQEAEGVFVKVLAIVGGY